MLEGKEDIHILISNISKVTKGVIPELGKDQSS